MALGTNWHRFPPSAVAYNRWVRFLRTTARRGPLAVLTDYQSLQAKINLEIERTHRRRLGNQRLRFEPQPADVLAGFARLSHKQHENRQSDRKDGELLSSYSSLVRNALARREVIKTLAYPKVSSFDVPDKPSEFVR